MSAKNTAVYGLYKNQSGIEVAVGALRQRGFRNADLSVLIPENQGLKDVAIARGLVSTVTGGGSDAYWEGILLSVDCDSSERVTRAEESLKSTGAESSAVVSRSPGTSRA